MNATKIVAATSRAAALLFVVFIVSIPVYAQLDIGRSSSGSVALRVCNEGKMDIDVFVSQAGKVVNSHISPAKCADVSQGTEPAFVGFAFAGSRGQWGAARRFDLLPDFGHNVLTLANRNETVRHGNANVTLPMQLSFRPRYPECRTNVPYSEQANLPPNATARQRAAAEIADANRAHRDPANTTCETLDYILNVEAFPDTREVAFRDTNAPAPDPAQRMNWSDLLPALRGMTRSDKLWDVIPRYIVIRGTVSSVEVREDAFEPGIQWVDVAFHESPTTDGGPRRPYSEFNVCASKPDIFKALFGADFRTNMIGKSIEVEGETDRSGLCRGLSAGIRVTLARQVRLVQSAEFEPGTVPKYVPPTPKPVTPKLTPEQVDDAKKRFEKIQEDSQKRVACEEQSQQWKKAHSKEPPRAGALELCACLQANGLDKSPWCQAYDSFSPIELGNRLNSAMVRAMRAEQQLDQLESKQAGQSTQLPADVRDARKRLDTQRESVYKAMGKHNNLKEYAQSLQSYEATVYVIEKYLKQ